MADARGTAAPPGQTVVRQPLAGSEGYQLMPHPGAISGVPPGLEYLASVDQLIVKQVVELLEVLTGFECKNKYRVTNSVDQQVFFAFEESECCNRCFCGAGRGFIMHITDHQQQDVMTLERPFKLLNGCSCCADGCCIYPIYVKNKMGQSLGTIRVMKSWCKPHFGIFDANDVLLYEIWGDLCMCQGICCTGDVNFPVMSMKDHSQVANVAKQWGGCGKECVSDADTYSVTFPMDLPVVNKALLLATIFLIDFSLHESSENE